MQPYSAAFAPTINALKQDPKIQVGECVSPLDACSMARKAQSCVILIHVATADEARRQQMLVKLISKQIRTGQVRVIITHPKSVEQDAKRLAEQLSSELIQEPTQAKGLLFKIDRLLKALPKPGEAAASAGNQKGASAPKTQAPVKFTAPLEIQSDIWMNVKEGFAVQNGRWTIQLRGPAPDFGKWERYAGPKLKIGSGREPRLWIYVPTDLPKTLSLPELIREEGAWIFQGAEPKYQDSSWVFTSLEPVLGFFYDGESYGNKFAPDGAALSVSQNSQAAVTAITLVEGAKSLIPQPQSAATRRLDGASQSRKGDDGEGAKATFVMVEPLQIESDCYLLMREKPKRISRKWVIPLAGPTPDHGKWVPAQVRAKGRGSHDDEYWQWEPTDPENDEFLREQGSWIFRGVQPRFVGTQWIFSGVSPDLSFYYEGENYGTKIGTRADGSLAIARDSQYSMAAYSLIEASLEKIIKAAEGKSKDEKDLKTITDGGNTNAGARGEDRMVGSSRSDREFIIPIEQCGGEGEWSNMNLGRGSHQMYMLFPKPLMEGRIRDVRKMKQYWIYTGSEKPKLLPESDEMLFKLSEPRCVRSFGALPLPLQKILTQQFTSKELIREKTMGGKKVGKAGDAELAAKSGIKIFNIPKAAFGDKNGAWEVTSGEGSGSQRWFIFMPANVDVTNPENLKNLKVYWTYFGRAIPRSVKEKGKECWSFISRKPVSVDTFADLPKPVQLYFRTTFGVMLEDPADEAESGAETEATDDDLYEIEGEFSEDASDDDATVVRKKRRRSKSDADDQMLSGDLQDEEEAGDSEDTHFGEEGTAELTDEELEAALSEEEEISLSPRHGKKRKKNGGSDDELSAEDYFEDEGPEVFAEGSDDGEELEARQGRGARGRELEASQSGDELGDELEAGLEDLPEGEELEIRTRRKKSRKGNLETTEDDAGLGDELEATQDGPGLGDELEAYVETDGLGAELEATQDADDEGDEYETTEEGDEGEGFELEQEGSDPGDIRNRRRRKRKAKKLPPTDADSPSEPAPGDAPTFETAQGKPPAKKSEKSGKSLNPGTPQAPTLSPLSIAFLMSELMSRRGEDPSKGLAPDRIAHRFCSYVSTAVGGLRVELWVNGTDGWYAAGSFDEKPATLAPLFESIGSTPKLEAVSHLGEPGIRVPITETPGASEGSRVVGVLVFVGQGAEALIPKWISSVAHMSRGFLLTLSKRAALDEPAPAQDEAPSAAAA